MVTTEKADVITDLQFYWIGISGLGLCHVSLVITLSYQMVQAVELCPPGHVLYTPVKGKDICMPCNPGTFMPGGFHTRRLCYDCSRIENPDIEIMVRPCNTLEDTVIHCIEEYFWEKSSSPDIRGQCRTCSSCPFPKLPCDRFRDTVCCPGDNYDVVINKLGIPVCVQLCGRGDFYDSGTDKCQLCPENSYMNEDRHTHTHCLPCLWPKSVAEVVVHPCNRTHPAVIGCKVGWYKCTSPDFPYTTCALCQRCSQNKSGQIYEGRVCTETSDAVCCSRPDMTVVDTPGGPQCAQPPLTTTKSPENEPGRMGVSVEYEVNEEKMETKERVDILEESEESLLGDCQAVKYVRTTTPSVRPLLIVVLCLTVCIMAIPVIMITVRIYRRKKVVFPLARAFFYSTLPARDFAPRSVTQKEMKRIQI